MRERTHDVAALLDIQACRCPGLLTLVLSPALPLIGEDGVGYAQETVDPLGSERPQLGDVRSAMPSEVCRAAALLRSSIMSASGRQTKSPANLMIIIMTLAA